MTWWPNQRLLPLSWTLAINISVFSQKRRKKPQKQNLLKYVLLWKWPLREEMRKRCLVPKLEIHNPARVMPWCCSWEKTTAPLNKPDYPEAEVEIYMRDNLPSLDINPLDWWKVNERRFPRLASLHSRDFCAIWEGVFCCGANCQQAALQTIPSPRRHVTFFK